jgi:hypothetical protein
MMMWRAVKNDPPPPYEYVLTRMKHGLISGQYDPDEGVFNGYYWRDMEWFADHWMPLPPPPSEETPDER